MELRADQQPKRLSEVAKPRIKTTARGNVRKRDMFGIVFQVGTKDSGCRKFLTVIHPCFLVLLVLYLKFH